MNDRENGKFALTKFLASGIWELDPAHYTGVRRYLVKYAQIMVLVCKDFVADQCFLRASALTFTTLLSIVPLFALMFALLKGLGVQNRLEPLLLDQVAAGSQEVVSRIITYINNTNVASVGAIGLVTLVGTVIALLGNVEEAFNGIWGVRETRSLYRKFSDYLSVVVSGPLLLLAATSMTTTLQSQDLVQWLVERTYLGELLLRLFHVIPYISIWMALVFLYIFIPNTKVRLKSAIIGGILAGTIWQVAQWGYIHFQVGVARNNAIYGTLALLPVFMVWLYASWLIVLFGVEVVYAHQHIRNYRREVRIPLVSHSSRESLALAILLEITAAFHYGAAAWNAESLAEHLEVPERIVHELLSHLAEAGFVAALCGEGGAYLPARELENIGVKEVLDTLRNQGMPCLMHEHLPVGDLLGEIIARLDAGTEAALAGMTMKDLVVRMPAGSGSSLS